MTTYVFIGAALLLGVAALATFIAFQNPAFWISLASSAAVALMGAAVPLLKSSPETQAKAKRDSRLDIERTINGREKER